MKKHLIAAAALATLSTAAFAQSATVYGFLDIGVFTTNNAGTSGKSLTTMEQAGGNWFPSMYGITGTEDLGGGMKASFNLQGSLSVANGNNTDGTNNLFGRYASVTLSGAAGSVELGRQIDLLFLQSFVNGVIPTHANSLAVNGLLAYGSSGTDSSSVGNVFGSRINNAVTYRTPTVNGVQGAFMYAPGGTAGSSSANALYSGLVTANVSGVALSAAYESQNNATTNDVFKKSLVGAKYSVGSVDLAGQYHTYKDTTRDVSAYELGVAYHVSPKLNVGVNYEHFSNDLLNTKPTITSLKAKYDFSKRTYLYGMAARYNGAAATEIFQGYGVGVLANTTTALGANKTATNFAFGVVHGF